MSSGGHGSCCVKSCKNSYRNKDGNIKFYSFPKAGYKKEQCERWIKWVKKVNPPGWEPSKYSRICSDHFVNRQLSTFLASPSYVPSILHRPNNYNGSKEKSSFERFQRSVRRIINNRQTKSTPTANNCDNRAEEMIVECQANMLEDPFQKKDQAVQAYTYTKNYKGPFEDHSKVFLCHQFTNNDINHVQLQVYIPEDNRPVCVFKKRNTANKSCGTNIMYENRSVGPDTPSETMEDILSRTGFHGFSSITDDKECLDLCGVTIEHFNRLLKVMPPCQGTKIDQKDRLMIFLIKTKTGITFSALSVLFRIHRTTVTRIFESVLKLFKGKCQESITGPSRSEIDEQTPEDFKDSYLKHIVIECTANLIKTEDTTYN